MGEFGRIPAAIVRGLEITIGAGAENGDGNENGNGQVLLRDAESDLFR